MEPNVELTCSWCKNKFSRLAKEYRRQTSLGRLPFCSSSCATKFGNSCRISLIKKIKKICKYCKKEFDTVTGKYENNFCSRSCAASGSMTEKSKKAQIASGILVHSLYGHKHLIPSEETLLKREFWKYEQLDKFLKSRNILFKFEYRVGEFVFDLAFFDKKILIEFDGPYHRYTKQAELDKNKDKYAQSIGWKVVRIQVERNSILDPSILVNNV